MKNGKVLFIYKKPTTFVKTDIEILKQKYEVVTKQFYPYETKFQIALNLLKQLTYLFFTIHKYRFIYIWFADYHAYLPIQLAQLFRKKTYIVIGGFDVARIPELNYGVFCSKLRGYLCITAMKNATFNLSVSKYVHRKVKAITHKTNSLLVYNCVNLNSHAPTAIKKESLVLTVGIINSKQTFYIKGLDTFIDTAKQLPDYNFLIIGLNPSLVKELNIEIPKNLTIIPKVEHEQLINYYLKAKVYCQLSRVESFGVALAESIYYGCIPIVTNEGGMKEVIGDRGIIVRREIAEITNEITKNMSTFTSPSYHNINSDFSFQQRQETLHTLFEETVK